MAQGPVLLERDHLLAELDQRLDAAGTGAGSLVLIGGEAGAGKTALVDRWITGLGSGTTVLSGACDPLTTPRPLSPLLDIAADPESGLQEVITDEVDPLAVFESFLATLRSPTRPVVLVVEDVHWADDGTLDFLRFLGRRVGTTKAVALCTYRDDEIDADHELTGVLGDLATRASTVRMSVEPLTLDAVSDLASDASLDPERLHRVTGGNPFFVTEVLAAGTTEEIPETVQHAVLARVRRLDDGPRRVVEAASVAPRRIDVDDAVTLADVGVDAVEAALRSGAVVGSGRALEFRHELARAAVEDSLPTTRRLRLHGAMLDLLIDRPDPDPARLAHHALSAEAGELVAEHAPHAARQAVTRGAHREAARFYQMALDRAEHLDAETIVALRASLADELFVIDDQPGSLRQRELVVEHHRRSGDPLSLSGALLALANSYCEADRPDLHLSCAEEAADLLRPLEPSPQLGRALAEIAWWWMLYRYRQQALDHCDEAVEAMRGVDGAERIADLIGVVRGHVEVTTGDVERGIELVEVGIRRYEQLGARVGAERILTSLGMIATEVRVYDVARSALERAAETGRAAELDYNMYLAEASLARLAFEQGRWHDAAQHADVVLTGPSGRSPLPTTLAHGVLGRIAARRGNHDARRRLEAAAQLASTSAMVDVWFVVCGLAEQLWSEGAPAEIAAVLDEWYAESLASDSPWARGEIGFWMWKAGAIDAPPDGAAAPYALQMAGEWRAAADAWHEIGCPYEQALALADGDEAAMLAALEIFRTLAARPAVAWVSERLRRAGVTAIPRGPRPSTKQHPAGLTSRQVEVLELMIEGRGNREIADRLFISPKTVEHHVGAILTRLGVATRPEAIAAGSRLGARGTGS